MTTPAERNPLPRSFELLLAHLSDPTRALESWRTQLSSRGMLLIEDLEDVEAPAGPLRDYELLSAEIVRSGGGVMYAGRALAAFGGNRVPVTVSAAAAAAIYLFNVRRWRSESAVDPAELNDRARALTEPPNRESTATVSWIVRPVALPA